MTWQESLAQAEAEAGMTQAEARARYGSGEEPIPAEPDPRRGAICALVFLSFPPRPLTKREIERGQQLVREHPEWFKSGNEQFAKEEGQ